ncbi:hypothetical protein ASD92_07160 [Massilia sp. Root1485]|nr:hypothetical protein ASD92_07160 [Massilia sp. Root1485]
MPVLARVGGEQGVLHGFEAGRQRRVGTRDQREAAARIEAAGQVQVALDVAAGDVRPGAVPHGVVVGAQIG